MNVDPPLLMTMPVTANTFMEAKDVPSPIVAWLDVVRDGLGVHASIFISYGALTVADLADFDEDDINETLKTFAAAGVPRFVIKKIAKALGEEAARTAAAREVANRIPSSSPTATAHRTGCSSTSSTFFDSLSGSGSSGQCESDPEQEEDGDEKESSTDASYTESDDEDDDVEQCNKKKPVDDRA